VVKPPAIEARGDEPLSGSDGEGVDDAGIGVGAGAGAGAGGAGWGAGGGVGCGDPAVMPSGPYGD
jgi:hypothetical protein